MYLYGHLINKCLYSLSNTDVYSTNYNSTCFGTEDMLVIKVIFRLLFYGFVRYEYMHTPLYSARNYEKEIKTT